MIIRKRWIAAKVAETVVSCSKFSQRKEHRQIPIHDYKGVIHVHSKYSDGTGSLNTIVNAALHACLDYVIITDHNTLYLKETGAEGWHENKVLLLAGEEVSSTSNEHCLALDIYQSLDQKFTPRQAIEEINRQKGLSFIVHPHGKHRVFLRIRDHRWTTWNCPDFTGLEIWSYMFDWIEKVRFYKLPYYCVYPERAISGPFADTLRKWDTLTQQRPVVGIAGVDAHAKGIWPLQVFSYRKIFKTLRTHIISSMSFKKNLPEDSALLYTSLRKGHCYFSYDLLSDATGFRFQVSASRWEGVMGDIVEFDRDLTLQVLLPMKARIRLIRNGEAAEELLSTDLEFRVGHPGVYRVEVYLQGKPWIFSNPIYVRQS